MTRIANALLLVSLFSLSLVSLTYAQTEKGAADDSFESRLATLDQLLESERVSQKIPGFAIAIVKDDKIVFSKGYGSRNLEANLPVETNTLFAIGSTTKAFTSTLIGMLVDEGKMQWDDPANEFLPEFKMRVDAEGEQISIRDLLCHRTGFTRMGLLWANGALTRDEIIRQAASAEPVAGFREKFLYSNVMYMVAGECAARAGNSDWDTLIADRIFKPLEMKDSSTSIRVAKLDTRLSLGYVWDESKEGFIRLPMRSIDTVAPAGSINSNVNDMAQWVRFQLSQGQFNGKKLLSREQHAETWKNQMKMERDANYGFGWMLRKWNNKQVVEHGGSIDGFGAQVTLLPEHNTGYVLLTNVTTTPFQQGSIKLVFDTLFKAPAMDSATPDGGMDSIATENLVGNYVANFGPFNNATMKVLMKEDSLALDVPGQKVFKLNAPDDKGKWYFAETDQIAISFNKNKEGKVISLSMYQGGAEPEFVRDDVELEPESPLSETAPLLGRYRDNKNKNDFEVVIRNGRLVIDKGRSAFTFLPPDENGMWALRPKPKGMQIRFNKNDDGRVDSLTWFQGGNEIEMPRISQDADEIPSAKALMAKVHASYGKLENTGLVGARMKGIANFVNQGAQGTVVSVFSNSGQFATRLEFGKMATIVAAYDGEKGFSDSDVDRFEELSGRKLKFMKLSSPLWFLKDWNQDYDEISVVGKSDVDGQESYIVSLASDDVPKRKIYVGAENGLILKEESVVINSKIGDIPVEVSYSDFRPVNGILMPFNSVVENPIAGKFVTQFDSVQLLTELPTDVFVVSAGAHAKAKKSKDETTSPKK